MLEMSITLMNFTAIPICCHGDSGEWTNHYGNVALNCRHGDEMNRLNIPESVHLNCVFFLLCPHFNDTVFLLLHCSTVVSH